MTDQTNEQPSDQPADQKSTDSRQDETTPGFTPGQLEAFLDEALPTDEMARIEQLLRDRPELNGQLARAIQRRDSGVHSIGEIWRRHRLTCPDRERLGAYLLGTMEPDEEDYIEFHLNVVGCRPCRANLDDLEELQHDSGDQTQTRRKRYFQSSAGYLNKSE